jgi:selenocysteine-specific elongation factor
MSVILDPKDRIVNGILTDVGPACRFARAHSPLPPALRGERRRIRSAVQNREDSENSMNIRPECSEHGSMNHHVAAAGRTEGVGIVYPPGVRGKRSSGGCSVTMPAHETGHREGAPPAPPSGSFAAEKLVENYLWTCPYNDPAVQGKDPLMTRDLIVGTAGHIDHGKTSLVKALTGIDTDRLPEEKARGITIDIGFATLEVAGFRLGIVDVPGHERFIKNMLAGATGIDLAVLVVAADDGVMPQTREHFEILKLLGLRQGVIALTKCDLVDAETALVVELDVRELVAGSFLEAAPLVKTSVHSGLGIDELKAALAVECAKVAPKSAIDWFRIAIDRSFTVQGHGTVITGSVVSGQSKIGDELEWLPGGDKVRVRSLQNHDKPVDEVHFGMRAAINLAGVKHTDVKRGQELARPGYLAPSRVLTVRLQCLPDMAKPIKHRAFVRLHIGTLEVMASVSVLDADAVAPGSWALAQLFLDEPVTATWGQPFVVRGSSATQTLGGGQVLQPRGRKVRRRHISVLERIEKLWTGDEIERALAVAWFGGYRGFVDADLVRDAAVPPGRVSAVVDQLHKDHKLTAIQVNAHRQVLLHADILSDLEDRVLDAVGQLHADFPLMSMHDRNRLQDLLAYVKDDGLVQATVDRLLKRKKLIGDPHRVARADFKPKLSANLRKLKDTVVQAFLDAKFQPPMPSSFTAQAGGNAANLGDLFDVCVAEGDLVHIADGIYLHASAEAEMRQLVTDRLRSGTGATVAEIRNLLGSTRKYAVPLCEYLDRIQLTRRDGDLRFLVE